MEAVPKLSMLSFGLKYSPENSDFILKIKRLIHTNYGEDPESFSKELSDLGVLRSNSCIRPTQDFAGIGALKKYYCQLNFLKSRFKIKKGTDEIFAFPWYDVYHGALYTFSDFHYEMSSVLYNIGALHSILGSREDRTTSDGMKVACTHFQCAAWAFHTLPDRYRTDSGTDMSPELLAFLSQVCLAQAQECILEKSILDHRKSSIIAKVGAQVADYYQQAFRKIVSSNLERDTMSSEESIAETVGTKMSRSWTHYVEFKMSYYNAVSYLYQGLQSEENQKMGERITYFEKAAELLAKSGKLAQKVDNEMISKTLLASSLTFSSDVINGKLDISKRENEFVYHEKVPDFDSLPELRGASLVKGMGFEITDPEISGPDIFARLVPLEAHEASSLYSEEKAQILRLIGSEIEAKNQTLEIFLSTLSLSEVPNPGDHIALPQELIEAAAGLSVHKEDIVRKLIDAMSSIASATGEVQINISSIREILAEEQIQENEYTDIIGPRPSPRVEEFDKECSKYEEAHRMASESNVTLHNAMKLHIDNLRLLSKPLDQLHKEIPSMADLDDESESNIAEVHRLLSKIDEMKNQREMFFEQLRLALHEDDITEKLLVQKSTDFDDVFKTELQKHDQKRQLIQKNLSAQDNILQALKETNARYASTRKIVSELINARNELIGSLVASFYAYDDLLQKASNGLVFYSKLNENVLKLTNKVKAHCKVQQEERDAILAKHHDNKKAAFNGNARNLDGVSGIEGLSLQDKISSSGGRPTLKDYLDMMKANKGIPTSATTGSIQGMNNSMLSPGSEHQSLNDQIKPIRSGYPYSLPQHPQSYSPFPGSTPPPSGLQATDSVAALPRVQEPSNHYERASPSSNFNEGIGTLPDTSKQISSEKSNGGFSNEVPSNFQAQSLDNFKASPIHQGVSHLSRYEMPQLPTSPGYLRYPGSPQMLQYPQTLGNFTPIQGQHSYQVQPQLFPNQAPPSSSHLQSPVPSQQFPANARQIPSISNEQSTGKLPQASFQPQNPQVPQPSFQMQDPPTLFQQQKLQYPQTAFQMQNPQTSFQPQNLQYPQAQFQPQNLQFSQGSFQSHNPPLSQPQTQPQQGQSLPSHFRFVSHQGVQGPLLINQQIRPPVQSSLLPHQQYIYGPQGLAMTQLGIQSPADTYKVQHQQATGLPTTPLQQNLRPNIQGQIESKPQPMGALQGPTVHQSFKLPFQPSPTGQMQGQQPQVILPHGQTTPGQFTGPRQEVYGGQQRQMGTQGYIQRQTFVQQYPIGGTIQGTLSTQIPSTNHTQVTGVPFYHQNVTMPAALGVSGPQYVPYGFPSSSGQSLSGPSAISQEPKLRAVVPQPGTIPQTSPMPLQPVQSREAPANLMKPQAFGTESPSHHNISNSVLSPTSDHQRKASFDELLNESFKTSPETGGVLQPKVMTASELKELKIEAQAREDIVKASAKDPYEDPVAIQKVLKELLDLESYAEDKVTLDSMWKQVLTFAENGPKTTVSVARCYPMKNRGTDVMPFDQTRVDLPGTKDDYINASRIKHLTAHSPNFIATQAPTPNTLADFWTMVWQEQVETMICLLPEVPDVYWPSDRKEPLKILESLEVTLQSVKVETHWTERIITVRNKESNTSRVVIHLQVTQSRSETGNSQLDRFVEIASSSLNYVRQQRVLSHPIVVHCLDGSGKTAMLCLIIAALAEVNVGVEKSGRIIPEMVQLAATLSQQRKGFLRDKDIFRQAILGVAKYTRDLLVQKGALEAKPVSLQVQKPAQTSPYDLIQPESNVRLLASQIGFETLPTQHLDPVNLPQNDQRNETDIIEKEKFFTPDLSRFADLSFDPMGKGTDGNHSPQKKKITKQDFLNKGSTGLMKNEANADDPLSQLDPLWSLK